MPPSIYHSDSDGEPSTPTHRKLFGRERPPSTPTHRKLFGRERPLYAIFGSGRVADVILWRNKSRSAAILALVTVIWFLFEVVEYPFLTLLCHISMTAMLVVFIWSNGAAVLGGTPPKIPEVILSEAAFREVSRAFHAELNRRVLALYDIARGKDLTMFILAIGSLWIMSVVGSYFSSLSLLYMCFVGAITIPVFYDKYAESVDDLVHKGCRDVKKAYRTFDSKVLNKIPRAGEKKKSR